MEKEIKQIDIDIDIDIDTEFTDLPVCPYCGDIDYEDGDYETFECEKCEKEYEVHLSVSYSFTTFTIEEKTAILRRKEWY